MYEYVALTWTTDPNAADDGRFMASMSRLVGQGWREYVRALFMGGYGGACIMRRPKDEPQEGDVEYEYMALSSEDGAYTGQCRAAVRNKELADKGWKNWRVIPWYESGIVAICVVRRELRCKDEPRKGWTERRELQKRNEELQAAIDEVVTVSKQRWADVREPTLQAVRRHLWSLVIKEESNGCLCG